MLKIVSIDNDYINWSNMYRFFTELVKQQVDCRLHIKFLKECQN